MSELWTDKWKPKNISEIVGHKYQIKKLKEWLTKLKSLKSQAIVISGNHGIGKTLTTKLVLEEFNYYPKIIYPNEIKDHRLSNDFEDYYNHKNSIHSKMKINSSSNIDKSKIALIFDDTETITLTSEKKYIINIFKENNKNKSFPLIFIANNQHSKLLNDLKKNSPEIKFFSPSVYDITMLIKKICKKEKLKFKDEICYDKLINFSQNDIRRLINLLQELSYHFKKENKKVKISSKEITNFIKNSREKNIDIGLFESTSSIINNYSDYKDIYKLYESEKVLLPLMIHENYKKKVLTGKNDWNETLFQMVKISDSISRGDNIETSIYTDQNWYLQNIHGFYTCLNTSFWINKNNNKDIKGPLKFSADLNKTSLKNINKKNISNLLKIVPKKSIQEILMLNRIANHLIIENKHEELVKKLQSYNKDISIKEVELCLKIDKTFNFHQLTTKEKKKVIIHLK